MAKCYRIEYIDEFNQSQLLKEFDTLEEANAFLNFINYNNTAYRIKPAETKEELSKDSLPAYFTVGAVDNTYLNMDNLEEFFMYDNMYSMGMNGLLYGSSMIGHKDFVDVVKRNGNLPSNGTSLGLGERDNIGVIKSTVINGVDVQDAQTSTSPIWYFNRYIKSQGKAGKYGKQIEKVFYEKIIPGFPLSQDELNLLTNFKSKLTPRKLVLRDHFNLGKTSFNIISREAVSIILNDNPQTRERLVELYRQITDESLSQEQYRNIVREIHSNYIPLKGREYHHNMLNDLELKKTAYIMVDSATKLIKPNVGQYVNGVFQYQQSTVSTEFLREQVSTDSSHKVKSDSVHGSQQQGLVWAEQDLKASLDYNINGKKGKVNIGNLVNHYFNLKSKRLEFAGNKLINRFLDRNGNVKRDTIVESLNNKSFKVKSENTVKELLDLNVSTSNAFVSKDSEAAIMSETSKTLKQRVAGNSYTLASSYGYNVVVDSNDNVIPSTQVKRNPRLYEKFDTRRLNFGKYDNNKNIYYAEVIVSQDFLDRMGIDDVANINNELLLGLGVRIPTEGKNSMVVLKVVDVLPRIYTGVILAPDEVINYSGADFDIDKMFVRHFDVYTDSNNNKQKYGSYLRYNTKENRLRGAYEEYLTENEEITLDRFSKKYGKIVEDNYNAKSFVEITPITKAETNNLLLDIEVLLAFNQYNREQAEYPNSLNLWKEVIIKDYLIKNGLDDKSGKLVTGISSTIDKLIAQDSIDVGGNNIGVAATFNIMYALLNHYGIKFDSLFLFDRAINFSDTTTIDVHSNKLDAEGLTKNGLIRKTAVIATLINMMTDNAKEQLAKELNLNKKNLSGFLIGVGVGLDLRALTLAYNKEINNRLASDYTFADKRLDKIISHVITTQDYGLETLEEESMNSYTRDIVLQERVKGIIQFLTTYTSEDIGDNLPRILNGGEYNYSITPNDYFVVNRMLFNSYRETSAKLSEDFIRLNTVRSLIKGASKSEFVALDIVYKALDELGVSYKTTETKLTTDLDKRLIIEQGVGYYRPILGEQEVIKYTFNHQEGLGRIIVDNQEIFSLLLNALVIDNHVAKYAHLKRSTIVRHFFQYTRRFFPLKRYGRPLDAKGLNQVQDAFLNYLNVRTFGNKLSQYYQQNPENSYYHALFKPSMFYVEEGNTHFIELLRARLLKSEVFTDNLFLQQLGVKYINSTTRTGQQLVSLEINTVNESKTEFKDGITNDLRLLDTKVNIIEAYNTLTTQGLDALTDKQVAQLIFVTVEAYSFVTTGHSFRPNSVSMFLPSPYLNKLYGKLTLVEKLFNRYNDVPMNKANTKKFNQEFKEITGTYFDRMLLEFYQFEGINNGFAYDVREATQSTIAERLRKKQLSTRYKYGFNFNSPLQRTLNYNGKTISITSNIIADFRDIIKESSDLVINAVASHMNIFNNHRFLQYTRVDDIKPAVFPPVIQHEGNNILSYVITIEGTKDNPIYTEYFYDYKNTGKVYQQRINFTEKGREVIGTLQESRYMPLAGFTARYSKMDKYADSQLSNTLPLQMYRNDAINIEQAFAESKEIIDGRTPSVIENSGVTDTELEQAKDREKEIIETLPPVQLEQEEELGEDKDSEFLDDLYKLEQELQLLELELDRYRNTAYGEIVDSIKSNKYTPQSAKAEAGVKVGIKKDIPIHLLSSKGNTVTKVAENIADRENIEREGYTYEDIRDMIIDYLQGNIKLRNEKEILKEIKIVKDLIKQIQQGLDVQIDFSKQEEVEPTESTPTNATQIYSQLGDRTKTPNIEIDNVAGRKASTSRGIVAYRTRGNNFLDAFEKDRTIGNPWNERGYGLYKSTSIKDAVIQFTKWLIGEAHTDKLQDYRQAIIDNLDNLRGRKIIYYAELNEPSHATALDYLINKYDWVTETAETTQEQPINPLIQAGVKPTDMYGNAAKDIQMASESTQFIGFQSGNAAISSTNKYRLAWGDKANTGNYTSSDIVMISGSGTFRGVTEEQIRKTLTERYKPLLEKAVEAGASFRVGNQYAKGNLSDKLVADYLTAKGYVEEKLDGYSRWSKPTQQPDVQLFTTKIDQFTYSYNPATNEVIHNAKTGDKVETNETQINKVLAAYAKANNFETKTFNKQDYVQINGKTLNVNTGAIVTQKQILDLFITQQPTIEPTEVKGINIKSDKTSPNSLANRLTNPNWYAKELFDVETAYKQNASKVKAPQLNAEEALKYDMNLMYQLQVKKFKQNPELIDEINAQGGLEFIKQSSHIVGVKNSRWEGKGMESNFIKVLAKSYETVAKELGKFIESPTAQQPTTDIGGVVEQKTAPNIRFIQNEFDEDLDEINMSLLQPIEFINTILNKYQVNGVIPKSKTLDVYNEVEKYNNRLGYQAINVYDNQGYIALDTNIDGQLNAKSTTETVINILNKLSNKFNIPYELDTTLPYKGIFTKGKVIVNPNLLTDDTPFHEFAHPFVAAIKRMNRPLYNQLIKEIKQEKTILDRTDKLYRQFLMNKGLSGTQLESSILEEAIVTAVGEYATDYNKLHSKSSTLLDSIREFLNFIKQSIMDMFNKNSVNIENIPNDITLRELAIILASDIKVTNQTKLNKEVLNILNQIDICS